MLFFRECPEVLFDLHVPAHSLDGITPTGAHSLLRRGVGGITAGHHFVEVFVLGFNGFVGGIGVEYKVAGTAHLPTSEGLHLFRFEGVAPF